MAVIEELSDDSSSGKQTPVDDIEVEELEPLPDAPNAVGDGQQEHEQEQLEQLEQPSTIASSLSLDEQASELFPLLLKPDPPVVPDPTSLAQHVLQMNIRALFLSNPNVSVAGRAQKASTALLDDANHDQAWKVDGIDLALRWCCSHVSPTSKLNLILPPTLTMMDDWEPVWRARGVDVLASWVFNVPPEELRSRGLDDLLLASLEHTLSLHDDAPRVLGVAVRMVDTLPAEERAKHYAALVEKTLVAGWKYAKREQQAQVARDTETLCNAMGEGIARWTKAVVPSLLAPLQMSPTPSTLDLALANLSALQVFIATVNEVHTQRWRGQILAILARCWVMTRERWPEVEGESEPPDFDIEMDAGDEEPEPSTEKKVSTLLSSIKNIYSSLAGIPGVKDDFRTLLKTNNSLFSPLVATLVA